MRSVWDACVYLREGRGREGGRGKGDKETETEYDSSRYTVMVIIRGYLQLLLIIK